MAFDDARTQPVIAIGCLTNAGFVAAAAAGTWFGWPWGFATFALFVSAAAFVLLVRNRGPRP